MNYEEVIATNPPRLVVLFQRGRDGGEQFQWGVVGGIPVLTMVGYIARVQADLIAGGWVPECTHDVPALVIAWDAQHRELSHFVHPDIPTDSLVGMLEMVKSMLVASRMGQHTAAQKVEILGPDGKPMRIG